MIDLLRDEVNRNFPDQGRMNRYYTLHCSPSFSQALRQDFMSFKDMSFVVDRNEEEPINKFAEYWLPGIGTVRVIEDMIQGYRLEIVSQETEKKAALPLSVTIIKVFPHMSNTYCVDNNYFMKGDTLMEGRDRYVIMTDPMPYGDTDSSYWVYTLDKPVPDAPGKKLSKEYFKN